MNRVVITGIGSVTPLSINFRRSWPLVKAGGTGIGPLTRINQNSLSKTMKWLAAGEIKGLETAEHFSKKELNYIDPCNVYADGFDKGAFPDTRNACDTDSDAGYWMLDAGYWMLDT